MTAMPDTAMIMAAGKGTRMMPLTANKPKPLIEVAGTTLLDHVLDLLRGAGVKRIVVNVHYFADQIERHLKVNAQDFDIIISDERGLLRDTGGGLIKALPLIPSDPFICINADNWFADTDEHALDRMAAVWDDAKMDVLMLVVPFDHAGNHLGQGDFDMDAEGRLSREGPRRARPYVWTGIQMLARRVVADPPSEVFSTNIFWDRAIAAGRCFGVAHSGDWFDVGYPEAIGLTEAALARG
jgi:MurNAc alpha-1-phosphate uridylyltransferase